MTEQTNDVKSQGVAQPSPAPSAGVSEQKQSTETASASVNGSSPAEALNTGSDDSETHVPYSRFKEVNEKARRLSAMEKDFESYKQLDEMLQSQPELFEKLVRALTPDEVLEQTGQTKEDLLSHFKELEKKVEQLTSSQKKEQEAKFQTHFKQREDHATDLFNRLTDKMSVQEKYFYQTGMAAELMQIYGSGPVALMKASDEEFKAVFNHVKSQFDSFQKSKLSEYVTEKKSLPPALNGSAPVEGAPDPSSMTSFERRRMAMESMKRAGQI